MKAEEQCKFGVCKKYCVCDKKEKDACNSFVPCKTYMDKYDNDIELWEELHGELKESEEE